MDSGTSFAFPKPTPSGRWNPDDDEGAETEPASAFDDLGDAVQLDDLFGQFESRRIDSLLCGKNFCIFEQAGCFFFTHVGFCLPSCGPNAAARHDSLDLVRNRNGFAHQRSERLLRTP